MFSLANSEAINKAATMSSREVADLTGKQHKHVLDDCRKMFDSLKIQSADFSADYQDERGRTYQEFLLDQDLTMTLVMGYSIPLRHKVAKRWRELESAAPALPQNLPEALRLAADLAEEKQRLQSHVNQLEHQVFEDAPKVEFHDKVAVAPGAMSVAQAAKILGTGRTRLFQFLRQIAWVTRYNEPYQEKIEAGYLDVKLGSWDHPDHGVQQSVTALITGKGLTKLQKLWAER
ncbi:phage antirepressor KilAC domain-containing protein [Serratia marcescens]|uniref:phage antirepressor KilAC domain-containing protein n=1 Tax=Serratia marcescens TaxID=615 RepID=UPI0011E98B33|nr:phage regulatory protein/antirepressor Ant [Serratia marcescens]TYR90469.1 DNA-binding protein [Serratia marcescens]